MIGDLKLEALALALVIVVLADLLVQVGLPVLGVLGPALLLLLLLGRVALVLAQLAVAQGVPARGADQSAARPGSQRGQTSPGAAGW